MRKAIVGFTFILAAAVAFAAAPDKLTISAASAKQGAVAFDHARHVTRAKTCETCHHNHKGLTKDTKAEVKKCTSCHLDVKGMPSAREMSMTKNPFHIRCVGCHKEAKKGPTACNGCHAKKA